MHQERGLRYKSERLVVFSVAQRGRPFWHFSWAVRLSVPGRKTRLRGSSFKGGRENGRAFPLSEELGRKRRRVVGETDGNVCAVVSPGRPLCSGRRLPWCPCQSKRAHFSSPESSSAHVDVDAVQKLPPILWKTAEGGCVISSEAGMLLVGFTLFPVWQILVKFTQWESRIECQHHQWDQRSPPPIPNQERGTLHLTPIFPDHIFGNRKRESKISEKVKHFPGEKFCCCCCWP